MTERRRIRCLCLLATLAAAGIARADLPPQFPWEERTPRPQPPFGPPVPVEPAAPAAPAAPKTVPLVLHAAEGPAPARLRIPRNLLAKVLAAANPGTNATPSAMAFPQLPNLALGLPIAAALILAGFGLMLIARPIRRIGLALLVFAVVLAALGGPVRANMACR